MSWHPSSKTIRALYERHATAFDRDRGNRLVERKWLDSFRAVIAPGAAVLDLGCGSGEPMARALIEAGHAVTGIDSSPTLIGLCRSRFPAHDWMVGDMRSLRPGRRFGGIMAWNSYFHLTPDDQRAMWPIFRDGAAPGAALMFTSGPAAGEAIGEYRDEMLYHASLDPADYRTLADAFGFDVVSYVPEDPECGGLTVWLMRKRSG